MIRRGLLALLLISSTAVAAEGSWTSQSFGGTLTLGKQRLKSRPVQVPSTLPKGAVASRLSWKIHADRHTPVGFEARVCQGTRCLKLPGLAGEMNVPASFSASGPWRFEYVVTARGPLHPALTILSNQLTLHYQPAGRTPPKR